MLEGEGEKGWKDTKWGRRRFLLRLVSLLSSTVRDPTRDEGESKVERCSEWNDTLMEKYTKLATSSSRQRATRRGRNEIHRDRQDTRREVGLNRRQSWPGDL